MQKDTIVKISSILQSQKYPKRYAEDSKATFFQEETTKAHFAQPNTSQNTKKMKEKNSKSFSIFVKYLR